LDHAIKAGVDQRLVRFGGDVSSGFRRRLGGPQLIPHRIGAGVVTVALLAFTWALRRAGQSLWARRFLFLLIWQIASGLSNVVLGWPLVAALAHTGGAAMLVLLMSLLLARSHRARIAA